jgi:hypothetical protein
MKEKQEKLKKEDVYTSGERNKVVDFFIGFGIFYGFSILLGILTFLINLGGSKLGILFSVFSMFTFIAPLLISIIIYAIYFNNRKFVFLGIGVGLAIPIILLLIFFGACLINPPT